MHGNQSLDRQMNKKSRITITPDVDVFVTDGNGCCASANGDEIYNEDLELGPRFSFVVPGIEEWLRRYEQATDFAETTTDPSFNWRRWHHEGLCFAKAIRERLPRCFSLYYTPPYEDRSQTVAPVEIDERIDELIESLRSEACNEVSAPSFKDNIEIAVKRKENAVNVLFQINRLRAEITVPFDSLHGLRNWLEKIIHGEEAVSVLHLPGNKLCFFPQTVGSHPEMARLWVMKSGCGNACFEAYVHTKEFVKSLYFSLMTSLGFFIYKSIDKYPSAEERHAVWTPYNRLKSQIVEAFVTEEACAEETLNFYWIKKRKN